MPPLRVTMNSHHRFPLQGLESRRIVAKVIGNITANLEEYNTNMPTFLSLRVTVCPGPGVYQAGTLQF
jgi:hypothetical protein